MKPSAPRSPRARTSSPLSRSVPVSFQWLSAWKAWLISWNFFVASSRGTCVGAASGAPRRPRAGARGDRSGAGPRVLALVRVPLDREPPAREAGWRGRPRAVAAAKPQARQPEANALRHAPVGRADRLFAVVHADAQERRRLIDLHGPVSRSPARRSAPARRASAHLERAMLFLSSARHGRLVADCCLHHASRDDGQKRAARSRLSAQRPPWPCCTSCS